MRFRDRYRVPSARLPAWDYRWAGAYGVTICVRDRQPWFGTVAGDHVHLSETGQIVAREWSRIPLARPYILLDEWIVMPDHMHGILIFGNVPDAGDAREPSRLLAHSLGAVVGQFKSKCTNHIWGRGTVTSPGKNDSMTRSFGTRRCCTVCAFTFVRILSAGHRRRPPADTPTMAVNDRPVSPQTPGTPRGPVRTHEARGRDVPAVIDETRQTTDVGTSPAMLPVGTGGRSTHGGGINVLPRCGGSALGCHRGRALPSWSRAVWRRPDVCGE